MSGAPLLLGIDLGTSSVKALCVTLTGDVVGSGSAEYPALQPQPGFAEQAPAAWWAAVQDAVRQATLGHAGEIVAVGLSGQMHGAVLLDDDRALLGNAIVWPDQRSAAQVRALTESIGAERLVEIAGSPVATGFQAATLLWLRSERPEVFARMATVLAPKDWLRLQLTGTLATDAGDGSGTLLLDVQARDWSEALLEAVGVARSQLPRVRPATEVAGALQPAAAEALGLRTETLVVVGSSDTACGMLGAGAVDGDTLIVNLSTGGQLVRPAAQPVVDRRGRLHTFCAALEPGPGRAGWYQMGATLNVGMALRWLRTNVLNMSGDDAYARITAMAADAPPGAGGLLFLPYLVGERTPLLDPAARAAFIGLTAAHSQAHLARAVLEGASFACYDAYRVLSEVADASAGPPQQVVLAGGGARSPLWRQIVADVFGVAVRRLLVTEQSALGAALLAGQGAGLLDAAESARAWVRLDDPLAPDLSRHARYGELFDMYQRAFQANRELMHELADWATG